MADKKTCFIIMPITTPDVMLTTYRDGKDHFKHVLECLFVPSIEKAGFKPIPPAAKGSDLVHAEIVENLEKSELVLCDMSCLNPNVFFEFGIRTSLNKPVSVVKDELTEKVPFDTAILNYQQYNSALDPWVLDEERDKLAAHLQASAERSNGQNTLWKYFGLKSEAKPYEGESGTENKLDLIAMQLESVQQRLGQMESARSVPADALSDLADRKRMLKFVEDVAGPGNVLRAEIGIALVKVTLDKPISTALENAISDAVLRRWGRMVEFRLADIPDSVDDAEQDLPDPFANQEA